MADLLPPSGESQQRPAQFTNERFANERFAREIVLRIPVAMLRYR